MNQHAGPAFLAGGGEMGALMREHDWSSTSLGAPTSWPGALRTLVAVMLGSRQPMFVAWGAGRTLLYNDGYAAILARKHPDALGQPLLDVWSEIQDDIVPIVEQAYAGEAVHMDDIMLVMDRHGYREETHFAFSYTPVRDEAGAVVGLFCPCTETTKQVLAERARLEAEARARSILETVREGVVLLDRDFRILDINPEGLRAERRSREDIVGRTHWDAWPGTEESELGRLYRRAMETREPASLEHHYDYPDGRCVWFDTRAYPHPSGIAVFYRDISERKQAEAALGESEARFRNMADNAPVMMWVTDPSGRCTYLNRRWYEFTGQAGGAGEGYGWLDAVHPDDRPLAERAFVSANAERRDYRVDFRLRRADGTYRWAIDAAAARFAGDGEYLGYVGSVINIDERREAEERLRGSEAEARNLAAQQAATLGQLAEGVIVTDAAGRITLVNEAAARLHGVSRLDVAPDAYSETYSLLTEDGRPYPSLDLPLARAVRGETVLEARWRVQRGDGSAVLAVGNARPVLDEAGRQIGAVLTIRDDTARRTAEEGLERLNNALEERVAERTRERDRVWRTSRDLFVLCGFDGLYRSANPAWTSALGYAPAELVGMRFDALVHPEDLPATGREFERLVRGTVIRDFDIRLRAADGSYRWYSWHCIPEGDEFYAAGRDITARKQLEEQLRQSQKMEAVGQLTGGLAHDFNNLLAGISGSLELLQARMAQGRIGDLERYITAAQGASKRAAALTHRLLAFTRRQTLDPKPTDVNRLVAGMEDLVRRTVGPSVAVEVAGAGGLWTTLVDPNQLENALLNLCINARDAMPDGGRLTIETGNRWLDGRAARERDLTPGQYVSLCVSDTGTGMTPEVARRAFDPFFTTKPIGMGTGLGLSMIHGFVQQSGGQARIYSEPGQGATVRLYLPRYLGAAEDAEALAELSAAPRAGQGETVLVVDDEPTVRMLVTEVLEDLGYTAVEAADGAAGLQVLRSNARVDLLVTDVGLPGLNGRQLADAGRAVRPELKVLFITGYAENAVLGHGHLDPGMHVLTKPFAMDALANRIKDLIAGT